MSELAVEKLKARSTKIFGVFKAISEKSEAADLKRSEPSCNSAFSKAQEGLSGGESWARIKFKNSAFSIMSNRSDMNFFGPGLKIQSQSEARRRKKREAKLRVKSGLKSPTRSFASHF